MQMATVVHGVCAKIKRMVLDRDTYPRKWGLGPHATEKKKMKAAGTLDKFGRPNDKTPEDWKENHPDLSAVPTVIKVAKDEIPINPDFIMKDGAKEEEAEVKSEPAADSAK